MKTLHMLGQLGLNMVLLKESGQVLARGLRYMEHHHLWSFQGGMSQLMM